MWYTYTPSKNRLQSNWNTYFLLCSIVTSLMSEQPHILKHPLQYNVPHFKYMQELEISNIKGCSWIIQFPIRNQVFERIAVFKSIWYRLARLILNESLKIILCYNQSDNVWAYILNDSIFYLIAVSILIWIHSFTCGGLAAKALKNVSKFEVEILQLEKYSLFITNRTLLIFLESWSFR